MEILGSEGIDGLGVDGDELGLGGFDEGELGGEGLLGGMLGGVLGGDELGLEGGDGGLGIGGGGVWLGDLQALITINEASAVALISPLIDGLIEPPLVAWNWWLGCILLP